MMNRICILGSIIIIILMIGIPTYFNVKKDHEKKLITAMKMEISDAAKKCFFDNVCKGNETTLGFLYTNNYLSKKADPVTKKYYDENSVITFKDKKIVLDFI